MKGGKKKEGALRLYFLFTKFYFLFTQVTVDSGKERGGEIGGKERKKGENGRKLVRILISTNLLLKTHFLTSLAAFLHLVGVKKKSAAAEGALVAIRGFFMTCISGFAGARARGGGEERLKKGEGEGRDRGYALRRRLVNEFRYLIFRTQPPKKKSRGKKERGKNCRPDQSPTSIWAKNINIQHKKKKKEGRKKGEGRKRLPLVLSGL